MNNCKEFHRRNKNIERTAARPARREWHDEKQFNDQCEKWWSGGLLPSLIDLLRRR